MPGASAKLGLGRSSRRSLLVLGTTYPPRHFGGYELMCRDYVGWRSTRGDDVTVLTSTFGVRGERPVEERGRAGELVIRKLNLPFRDYVLSRPAGLRLVVTEWRHRRSLDKVLNRCRPAAALVWQMTGISKSLLAQIHGRRIPILLVIHEGWPATDVPEDPWVRFWARGPSRLRSRLLKPPLRALAARVIAPWRVADALAEAATVYCSDTLRREVEAKRPELSGRGVVVHDGIDVGRLSRSRDDDEPLGQPLRLLYAGRVEKRKGAHTAVAVLAGLARAGVRSRLRIIGWRDDVYADYVRARAKKLSVDEDVVWSEAAGHDDMPDVYRNADVLLF